MSAPTDWRAGLEVTSDRLRADQEYNRTGRAGLAAGSGMAGAVGADGTHLIAPRSLEGWFRVTLASTPAGWYTLAQLVDQPDGTWAQGTRGVRAREAGLNAAVPADSATGAIVYAYRGRLFWTFAYSKCPTS